MLVAADSHCDQQVDALCLTCGSRRPLLGGQSHAHLPSHMLRAPRVLPCSPSPSPPGLPSPSPSPSPAPVQPKLALLSEFPASYSGSTANLTATGPTDTCTEAPSTRLAGAVTIVAPGAGVCFTDGTVDGGLYNLTAVAPAGTVFVGWTCYDTTSGTAGAGVPGGSTTLPPNTNTTTTCVALFDLAASPSPSPR